MRKTHGALMLCLCIFLVWALAGPVSSAGQTVRLGESGQRNEKSDKVREWERQQQKARNKQRQEDLKKDTDKLLQLATDLKLAVDKSNEQTLSMSVIKKAEEIEKLSKAIQKKMKGD